MAGEFLLWRPGVPRPGVCLTLNVEVPDEFELGFAVSRQGNWPKNASCSMDPIRPKDIRLADGLFGSGRIVVSPKVQASLKAQAPNRVEILPLAIVNHKGRIAASDYAVVNPLDVVDCIDIAASGVTMNSVNPTAILGCTALVLNESAVPAEMKIFRLAGWLEVVVVRRSLAEQIIPGTEGLRFCEPAEYSGAW